MLISLLSSLKFHFEGIFMALLKVGKNMTGYFYSDCRWCHLLTTGKKCWIRVRTKKWVRIENVFIFQLSNYTQENFLMIFTTRPHSQSYSKLLCILTWTRSWKSYSCPGISNNGKLRVNKRWIYLENEWHESAEELINATTFSNACWDQDNRNVFCPLGKKWNQCKLWQ